MRSAVIVVVGVAARVAFGGLALAGCVDDSPVGATGAKGKVVFQADPDLIFTTPVGVGSTFRVVAVAKNDDVNLSKKAVIEVDDRADDEGAGGDATITAVEDEPRTFDVTLTDAGSVRLAVVDDGETIDTITIDARAIGESALVDGALIDASEVVDARLPQRFAIIDDAPTRLLVSAVDRCAAGVLDLGASTVVVVGQGAGEDETVDPATLATVSADGPAAFIIEPVEGATGFTVELHTGDLAVLAYEVDVVARGAIDEVHAEVASVDTQASTARLWGRAFVDDVDVVGLDFGWSGDARVLLDRVSGPAAIATITFPEDGSVDERPAVVRAEVFGTEGDTDLLALQAGGLVVSRGDVPERPAVEDDEEEAEEPAGDGCTGAGGGAGTCTAAIGAVFALRRRRLLRA